MSSQHAKKYMSSNAGPADNSLYSVAVAFPYTITFAVYKQLKNENSRIFNASASCSRSSIYSLRMGTVWW